jgi:lysyl-tRNA synthetase class 2
MSAEDTNSLIEQRKAKLTALKSKGIDPFKNKFTPDRACNDARSGFESGALPEGTKVSVAGRITAHREMGKSIFVDVRDQSGRIQVYAQKNALGEEQWHVFTHLDLGDFIGVTGTLFRTKTGEPSIKLGWGEATDEPARGDARPTNPPFVILAKALRPPPAKWHGLEDTEIRYRQRYLDLIGNPDVKEVFLKRSAIVHEIRSFFHSRGYVEVETPAMQAIPGGAAAQPFKTFHNALGCEFYLRIALELYHKRLLVGGIDKLFEIGKNFRNEGLSRRHNPEFTMLEAYQAYGDYETMMETVQSLIKHIAQKVLGTLVIEFKDAEGKVTRTIDLTNWRRVKYKDLICQMVQKDWFEMTPRGRFQRALELGCEFQGASVAELKKRASILLNKESLISSSERQRLHDEQYAEVQKFLALYDGGLPEDFEVTVAVFEKLIEPTLINPTFVTHLPKELVPLAKLSLDDPTTVEVFECCINGQEISPGYTEQNDPIQQRATLEHQAGGEQQKLDEDFLVALEHGMPPAGGIGIGIDRLCMMLLGQESIRDVILFPQLKPK